MRLPPARTGILAALSPIGPGDLPALMALLAGVRLGDLDHLDPAQRSFVDDHLADLRERPGMQAPLVCLP